MLKVSLLRDSRTAISIESVMNWTEKAKLIFNQQKPEHFTNYNHCEECNSSDAVLRQFDVDNISDEELSITDDPLTFSSVEGKKYYMPALVRLSLANIESYEFLELMLRHLEGDGDNNSLYESCNAEQRKYICNFCEYLVLTYPSIIESFDLTDTILRVLEIWSDNE